MTQAFETLEYDVADGVATIRLNDPSSLNAITTPMGQELLAAVDRAQAEARAILLTGAGRAFSSGANLTQGGISIDDPNRDAGIRLEQLFNPLILRIRSLDIPIVAAVRGGAVGVGCAIALACDIIIASDTAFFYQAFRNIGLVPDGGSSYLLTRAIGRVRAMEMMLLGERIPAAKALDWGMITRVVDDDALDAAARAIAVELATASPALGLIRDEVWAALDASLVEQLAYERALQRRAGRSADFPARVRAFRERKKG